MLLKGKNMDGPGHYEIVIAELLDKRWEPWFGGLKIIHPAGSEGTILRGKMADQAELFGVLDRIRDRGLTLISVKRQSLLRAQPARRKSP